MLRGIFLTGLLAAALLAAGCGGGDDSATGGTGAETQARESPAQEEQQEGGGEAAGGKPTVSVPDGPPPKQLQVRDIEPGDGPEAKKGDQATVDYVGVLYENGREFDASFNRGEPFTFTLGNTEVIPGWEQGVEGMKVGGRRELIIPPHLAYGSQELGPIPANSTLVFVVDLRAVN